MLNIDLYLLKEKSESQVQISIYIYLYFASHPVGVGEHIT